MNWIESVQADPVMEAFEVAAHPGVHVVMRRGYLAAGEELGVFGGAIREVDSASGGRDSHPIVELSGGERVLIRHYRRGGLLRKLNRQRYFLGHRAIQEARITEHAARRGVRVPLVIGAWERRSTIGYTAAFATRWIPDASPLDAWLSDRSRDTIPVVLRSVGIEISRMHEAGIGHPDLNLRNVLVAPADDQQLHIFLIDFDRARLYPPHITFGRRRRDLLRFRRSARKLGVNLAEGDWRIFREGYGDRWPLPEPLG